MKVPSDDIDALTAEWLVNSQRKVGERRSGLDAAAQQNPELAWATILKIIEHSLTDEQTAFLAAGPLEVLLSDHGATFIDRVEREAAANPRFDHLLGGVWKLGMTGDVWNRVQKSRSAVW